MAVTAVTQAKAGFGIRFVALLIDAVILAVIGNVLRSALFAGDATQASGLTTLLGIAYYVYLWGEGGKGQTLGMRVFGIRVVRTDGGYLTVGGALIRYVMFIVSCIALFIGLIWAAFDPDKQGWHDKVAGTYVVKAS